MPNRGRIGGAMEYQEREVRKLNVECEMRIEGDGDEKIVGYAAVFDKPSVNLGGFTERIRKGAFKKTIGEADVRALFNHDPNYVLGRTKSGTLRLEEDDTGLRIEIDPPKSGIVRDLVMEPIRRGDVDQMSFAFNTVKDAWTRNENGTDERELIEVRLHDISPVTYPAYPDTSVGLREDINTLVAELRAMRTADAESEPVENDHSDEATEPPENRHSARARLLIAAMGCDD